MNLPKPKLPKLSMPKPKLPNAKTMLRWVVEWIPLGIAGFFVGFLLTVAFVGHGILWGGSSRAITKATVTQSAAPVAGDSTPHGGPPMLPSGNAPLK